MTKSEARQLLGGTDAAAAAAVGVSRSAFSQWPEILPARLVDRVQAAIARRYGNMPRMMAKAARAAGAH